MTFIFYMFNALPHTKPIKPLENQPKLLGIVMKIIVMKIRFVSLQFWVYPFFLCFSAQGSFYISLLLELVSRSAAANGGSGVPDDRSARRQQRARRPSDHHTHDMRRREDERERERRDMTRSGLPRKRGWRMDVVGSNAYSTNYVNHRPLPKLHSPRSPPR